ncbi:hypothetical protein GTA09_15345 [Rhodococcus hoagii]|nr:hypothetical protein [Prescottella equi]NKZ71070.1 hypothetical protein [Prescottella equi]
MLVLPITKNAPAPAATGNEGNENQSNTHEGTDSTVTVPNTPALDQWNAMDSGIKCITADNVVPDHRKPAWCDEITYIGATATSATMLSAPAAVVLRRHPGLVADSRGSIEPAVAYVDIRQSAAAREPYIHFERWAAINGKRELIAGSDYGLTLDEAEELAHTLTLAVATAREALEGRHERHQHDPDRDRTRNHRHPAT